MYVYMYKKVVY